jgi:hypothetical protein
VLPKYPSSDRVSKEQSRAPIVDPGRYFDCFVSCSSAVRTFSTSSRACWRTVTATASKCIDFGSPTSPFRISGPIEGDEDVGLHSSIAGMPGQECSQGEGVGGQIANTITWSEVFNYQLSERAMSLIQNFEQLMKNKVSCTNSKARIPFYQSITHLMRDGWETGRPRCKKEKNRHHRSVDVAE